MVHLFIYYFKSFEFYIFELFYIYIIYIFKKYFIFFNNLWRDTCSKKNAKSKSQQKFKLLACKIIIKFVMLIILVYIRQHGMSPDVLLEEEAMVVRWSFELFSRINQFFYFICADYI